MEVPEQLTYDTEMEVQRGYKSHYTGYINTAVPKLGLGAAAHGEIFNTMELHSEFYSMPKDPGSICRVYR